mgnify:CR=1 FL=1
MVERAMAGIVSGTVSVGTVALILAGQLGARRFPQVRPDRAVARDQPRRSDTASALVED